MFKLEGLENIHNFTLKFFCLEVFVIVIEYLFLNKYQYVLLFVAIEILTKAGTNSHNHPEKRTLLCL